VVGLLFMGLVQTLHTIMVVVRHQGESRCEGIDGQRLRGSHSPFTISDLDGLFFRLSLPLDSISYLRS
jgi:hypothetical protein